MPAAEPASRLLRFFRHPLPLLLVKSLLVVLPLLGSEVLAFKAHLSELAFDCLVEPLAVALIVGLFVLYTHRIEQRRVTELSRRRAPRELLAGCALGTAIMAAVVGLLAALHLYRITGVAHWDVLIPALLISFSSGVSEELLFRGVLFRIIEDWLGSWWALALSAAFFGAAHLLNPHATGTAAVAIMIEAGIMLGAAYMLTRRLWLPIGIHAGWNFTQGGIFGVSVSGTTLPGLLQSQLAGPDWLSGGQFGAEASIVAVALSGTVGVLLLVSSARTGSLVATRRHRPPPPLSGA